jgi:hypothetical protein
MPSHPHLTGDTTWTECRWSGTRSDGQAFEMRGVTLFEVTGGQIVAGRLHLEDVEQDVVSIEQAAEEPVRTSAPARAPVGQRSTPASHQPIRPHLPRWDGWNAIRAVERPGTVLCSQDVRSLGWDWHARGAGALLARACSERWVVRHLRRC